MPAAVTVLGYKGVKTGYNLECGDVYQEQSG